jgi:hypothetical protein
MNQAKRRRAPVVKSHENSFEHEFAGAARAPKRLPALSINVVDTLPLWQLDTVELTGHNLEARGREEVNPLLGAGWRLLHIYTLKYHEDSVWRERPMAILGRPRALQRSGVPEGERAHESSNADHVSEDAVVAHR